MEDKKAMRQAAMDMLSKLQDLDLSKAKMVSVSVVMNGDGIPSPKSKGMHKMPNGKMMADSEMESESEYSADTEESSGEYCSDCGMKKSECECD